MLKSSRVRENKGLVSDWGYLWKSVRSALTGQAALSEDDSGIVFPVRNWSVFDFGRRKRTPEFVNVTDCLERRII